jgi:hypothetical protein
MSLAKVTLINSVKVRRYGLYGFVAACYIKLCGSMLYQVVWQHVISSCVAACYIKLCGSVLYQVVWQRVISSCVAACYIKFLVVCVMCVVLSEREI